MNQGKKKIMWKNLILFGIFFLACFLRIYESNLTPLENDIIRDLKFTNNIIRTGNFYFGGFREGTGDLQETFGSVVYYLLAIPLTFSKSPAVVAAFMGILGTIAVIVGYYCIRRFFNERIAIIAALLYAVNPWAVFYSKFSWNPNFIPLFSIIFMFCLFKAVVSNENKYIMGACAALGILIQFHMITFFLFPLMMFTLKKRNIKYLIAGCLIFFMILTPYILHQVHAGRKILEPITDFAGKRAQENTRLINMRDSLGMPALIATNYYGKFMFGEKEITKSSTVNIFFMSVTVMMTVLLLLSGFFLVIRIWKKRDIKDILLVLWLGIPMIGYILLNKNISPHYGLMLYPVQFILIGIFMDKVMQKTKKAFIIAAMLIGIIIMGNGLYVLVFYNHLEQEGGTAASYGIPYKFKLEAAEYIVHDRQGAKPKVFFLKWIKFDLMYIFEEVLKTEPEYHLINKTDTITDEKEGYLILDRFSRYGYAERKLNESQNKMLDEAAVKQRFGGIEVIKLPLNAQVLYRTG